MTISDFSLKAKMLVDPDQGTPLIQTSPDIDAATGDVQPVVLESGVPEVKSRKWLFIGIAGGVLGVAAIATAILMFRRGHRQQNAGENQE